MTRSSIVIVCLMILTVGWSTQSKVNVDSLSEEEDTPVELEHVERPLVDGEDRPWRAPTYANQKAALGYSDAAFRIPAGLEDRVAFWMDIYTKYTTQQGVLHDSRYVHIVYEPVDFYELDGQRARRNRVKSQKNAIEERLKRLHGLKDPSTLVGEDLRYWKMFEAVDEKNKFLEASRKGRLRFQLGQRDRMIEGIFQSGRHIEEMEDIFRSEGLPIELTRLPFVESSFNLRARSKVGASGIWQFMRSTARQYMRMDPSVDERNDPVLSTRAAARKLRDNYRMLESWPLAVTGYNHGPHGVMRLVKKYKTTDITELTDVRKGRFGFASANFFASFLAALIIEGNAEVYFGPLKWMPALRGTEIKLDKHLPAGQLVTWFDGDLERAKAFNPHVRSHVWKSGRILAKNFIRVPTDRVARVESEMKNLKVTPMVKPGEGEPYVIQAGETLSHIADRFGVKIQHLLEINDIENPRRIRAGQKIIIPN